MKGIKEDVNNTVEAKKAILKDLGYTDIVSEFQNRFKDYKPVTHVLDQRVALTLSEKEKKDLMNQIMYLRSKNQKTNVSGFIRNNVLESPDIIDWADKAKQQLLFYKENTLKDLKLEKNKLLAQLDDAEDDESTFFLEKSIKEIDKKINKFKKKKSDRKYMISFLLTFDEARLIKWRAYRFNMTISDYVRYLVFGYCPGDETDLYMAKQTREQFYLSTLEVKKNGIGEPPEIKQCNNCGKYIEKIKELESIIKRYKTYN